MTLNFTSPITKAPHFFQSNKFQQFSFFFILSFILWTPSSFADNCEGTHGCMDFIFEDKVDNSDGTTTYCFTVINNCDKALSYVAFSVPQAAASPADNSTYSSTSGIDYHIENTTINPFLSIKFETIGEGFKKGDEDQFCFSLPSSIDYNTITIQSKASGGVYKVTIDFSDCISTPCDDLPPPNGGAMGAVADSGPSYPQSEITVLEETPFVIQNVSEPTGGSGNIETIWIRCMDGSDNGDCGARFEELGSLNVGEIYDAYVTNGGDPRIGDTCWEFVSDDDTDDNSLSVDGINSSACYVRCVRSIGCASFIGESNIVRVNTEPSLAGLYSSEDPSEGESTNRDLIAYPNPAYNQVSILTETTMAGQQADIIISNRLGQVMMTTNVELEAYVPVKLDTSKLPGGLYTVYLKTEGRKSISKKLVISRL